MGSHGGATAQGQLMLLSDYGVTSESVGVPIRSSMEVARYGQAEEVPLWCDRSAWEADGVVIFNKIKPHTEFRGEVESGLCKMVAIGLGKHVGAATFHSIGYKRFARLLPLAAEAFLSAVPLVLGVGVVQNAYDDICAIDVAGREDFVDLDKRLQSEAKSKIARFKFDMLDVLVIDEIGKNISGFGHDPNIVGRNSSGLPGFSNILTLNKLFIRGLTRETHHNGCGISAADITTRACLKEIDWDVSWTNVVTSTELAAGRIPLYMNTDREALALAIATCSGADRDHIRLARIRNTMSMFEIEVSEALYTDIASHPDIKPLGEACEMVFDPRGSMPTH